MGIVKKQVYKNTLVSYFGMVIGYFNVVLFVKNLSADQYGLYQLLIGLSVLYSLFASVGVPSIILKYFPFFRTENKKHNGFIYWVVGLALIGFLISTAIYISLKPLIVSWYVKDSCLFNGNFYLLIPLAACTAFFNLLEAFGKAVFQSIFSGFLKEVLLKVLTTFAILILSFGWITFNGFVIIYICLNCIIVLSLFISLLYTKQFSLKFEKINFQQTTGKIIISYGLFTLISSSVYVLWQKVDILMLSSMAGLSATGVYCFYSTIAVVINIPAAALGRTTYQIVADSWKSKNMANIQEVYYKTSIIQMVFGCLIFIGIIINKNNLLEIVSKKEYGNHFNWFIIIGLSCLIDITGGLNTYILSTSHKYKLITMFVIVTSLICIWLTYILIPIYGGIGAALAYLATITGFNFCNWLYLKYRFKLQPFTYKHIVVILIAITSFCLGEYFWRLPNLYLDIIVRSGTTASFYGLLTYIFRISNDINEKVDKTLVALKKLV